MGPQEAAGELGPPGGIELDTRYANSGTANIAYHVVGSGDVDVVFVPSFLSNIELSWELPRFSRFLHALRGFARLILFDRRGCGASDGPAGATPLEEQLDDVSAVLAATGSTQPVLLSVNEGCALALLFAASHPQLARALVLLSPQARLVAGPGYEWARPAHERDRAIEEILRHWGRSDSENPLVSFDGDSPASRRAVARFLRLASGPGDAAAALALAGETDVRDVLPSVQCPTLVLRRANDEFFDPRHSSYVAEHVPGARMVELPGTGPAWIREPERTASLIEEFVTGARPPVASERVLATVLFTDIVASTERAAELGDGAWRGLLERHDALARAEVERHRGRLVKSLGDGVLAVFDGPSRALGCALALRGAIDGLGLSTRAGLHTGECELFAAGDLGGMAVHIAARIAALAAPGEVLASSTVRDLSVGSPFQLASRGEQRLKGVPDPWRVFAVESEDGSLAA